MEDVLVVGFGAVGVIYRGIDIESVKYGNTPNWRPDRLFPSVSAAAASGPYTTYFAAARTFFEQSYTSKHPQPVYSLLQNGLGVEADLYQYSRSKLPNINPLIISTSLYIGTNLRGPHTVQHNDFDRLTLGIYKPNWKDKLGEPTQEIEQRAMKHIGDILAAGGTQIKIVDEIQSVKFSKNLWNATFATLATLTDTRLPVVFATKDTEALIKPHVTAVLTELLKIGHAYFPESSLPSSLIETTYENTAKLHRGRDNKHTPSMLLDRQENRAMEVDVIVGECIRMAKEKGISVPRLETLYSLLLVIQHQLTLKKASASDATEPKLSAPL
ncbi:6-phosphogluconate dehydrogenase C-terminal domain-like protein [Sistotremastrum suecicum HHB10207 ss-3]|uniref:6-phosphogluconate dehydrogenase C-terminal domain-like protein n=1 Tax=Sistotremastrum suecicum HHB10207 ss-3 TaxID=1314776 RepID=A0A166F049_9AGAM|nr:6-phosphogluconate dehydrogenase C-terminal domain-like protein [Sistotremastrum suecicum HHB10207 ss-3]